jgi:uncharacterized protein (TIGR03435 family)
MGRSAILVSFVLWSAIALAQDPPGPKFEVVSVKPAAPGHDGPVVNHDGPGTDDPELVSCERISLLSMLTRAYRPAGAYDVLHLLDFNQIQGPAWLSTQFYAIDGNLAPGTTKEQLALVWQNLLADRFQLKVHFSTKEFDVYELTVAKSGPKLHRSGEDAWKPDPGFPIPKEGANRALSFPSSRTTRQTFVGATMNDLIQQLAWPLSEVSDQAWEGTVSVAKVVDKTGLDGTFDFTLEYAGRPAAGGAHPPPLPDGEADTAPNLFDALRQQLGLQLEEKKMKLQVLVVDHVDKVPTDN